MDISLFDYSLPKELIADHPLRRGTSRMMVVHRDSARIEHRRFEELPLFLTNRDTVVFNETRVLPARLFGKRTTGGKVEFLLIKRRERTVWEVLANLSKRLKPNEVVFLEGGARVRVVSVEDGYYFVDFGMTHEELLGYLDQHGDMPLPPYILKKRGERRSRPEDKELYQTVYGKVPGSVAAPTAGLHFTDSMLAAVAERTDNHTERVTLDVGTGTFKPVTEQDITRHTMHTERYYIDDKTAARISTDMKDGRRIVAVGTTTVRTLESAADQGLVRSGEGFSDIFIYPGYTFRIVDVIFTNFHLPKSTLIMMISAFAGRELIMRAYEEAVKERYRFYSYGDSMLILPD